MSWFDATVDFEAEGVLEQELASAGVATSGQDHVYVVIVPADDAYDGKGLVLVDAEEPLDDPKDDDWVVVGHNARALASELRRLSGL